MKIRRRKSRVIKIGSIYIGGSHPVAIQSMAKVKTADIEKVVRQIKALEGAGCQIARLAVKDEADAAALKKIKKQVNLPLVADIHFNWRLALSAIDNGADKIRLNPGNIYKKQELREITGALKSAKIPLRIGVNSGSVNLAPARRGGVNSQRLGMPERLVTCALNYIKAIEKFKFYDIVVSLKASNVPDTIEAYRKIAGACDYPLHLGVTATGLPDKGVVKSAIAIGALLLEGIGDTIRVSLTDEPKQEVYAARNILESLGLMHPEIEVISCPTCGRCEVDLAKIVGDLEKSLPRLRERHPPAGEAGAGGLAAKPVKLAVMGCVVNGPGEAREADIGVAFGWKEGLLFRGGRTIKKVKPSECIKAILKECKDQ